MIMHFKGKIFVLNPHLVFREESEGAFIFDPEKEALHGMNHVGSSICRLLDGKNNLDNIHKALLEQYDVDVEPDQLKEDVQGFIDRLVALNLLTEKK
jgi:hypothetical protein